MGADLSAHVLKLGLLDDKTKSSAIVCCMISGRDQICNNYKWAPRDAVTFAMTTGLATPCIQRLGIVSE